MKKLIILLILFGSFVLPQNTFSQETSSDWVLGFGGSYPRFVSITSGNNISANTNYGVFASVQRNFSDHLGIRALANYNHLRTNYFAAGNEQAHKLNLVSGNLDLLYKILDNKFLNPYLLAGFGITAFNSDNSFSREMNKTFTGYQMNLGAGFEFKLTPVWSFKSEVAYRTASNNKIDGNTSLNENKGILRSNGDTYMNLDLGLLVNFPSKRNSISEIPTGITNAVEPAEKIIIKEIPVEIVRTKVDTLILEKPIIFGINFEFDKSNIRVESYPVLENVAGLMKQNPDWKLSIEGHTDNFGSKEYNKKLSQKRAEVVFNYFTQNGIAAERLITNFFGEEKQIKENDNDINRAFNRRTELKIVR